MKRNENKRKSGMLASALLLAPSAYGQSDGFFSNAGEVRCDANQEATWEGMNSNATPVGGGLLVLAAAGACYAAAKRFRRSNV